LSSLSTSISPGGGQAEHGDERRDWLRTRPCNRLLVGGDQRSAVHGQPLRTEQEFGRAQHRVVGTKNRQASRS
jgi:hypothetical protein